MTEEAENIVLRLLRDIRVELQAVRAKQDEHSHDFATVKRQMSELQETTAMALGLSAMTNTHYETAAQRLDRLTETVADLKARIEALEQNP